MFYLSIHRRRRKPPEELIKLTSQKRLTMWLQDKFVPELVIKKHSEPPNRERNRLLNNRPGIKGHQAVGRYFQNMGNKMSNLNPLKKVRLKGRMLNGPMVIFRKDSDSREAHDSDFEVDKDDEDSDDIVSSSSSSSATSFDALSIEDCLDIIGGNVAGDPELFINIPNIGRDEEVMLKTCGSLATSLKRNSRILTRRHISKRSRSRSGPYEDAHAVDLMGNFGGEVSPMLLSSAPEESSAEERKEGEENGADDNFDESVQSKVENENQKDENIPASGPLPDILPKSQAVCSDDQEQKPNDNDNVLNGKEQNANIDHDEGGHPTNVGDIDIGKNGVQSEDNKVDGELVSGQTPHTTKPVDSSTPVHTQQRKRRSKNARPELHVSVAKDEAGDMEVTVNPLPEFLNNEFQLCDLTPSPRSPISKSPQKSHSENSLADYLRSDSLQRDDSLGSDQLSQSSQDSSGMRRFKNPFKNVNFNLNVNFNRGSNLRASLLKAKQQLETEMRRSNTRFIQV